MRFWSIKRGERVLVEIFFFMWRNFIDSDNDKEEEQQEQVDEKLSDKRGEDKINQLFSDIKPKELKFKSFPKFEIITNVDIQEKSLNIVVNEESDKEEEEVMTVIERAIHLSEKSSILFPKSTDHPLKRIVDNPEKICVKRKTIKRILGT